MIPLNESVAPGRMGVTGQVFSGAVFLAAQMNNDCNADVGTASDVFIMVANKNALTPQPAIGGC